MRIEIDTKTRTVRINNDAQFEQRHPRKDDGEFTKKNGGTNGTLVFDQTTLKYPNGDIKKLRAWADEYYNNHLAGHTTEHPELGKVIFTRGGFNKPRSFSADPRKLKLVPALPKIIAHGHIVSSDCDRKQRKNMDCVYKLETNLELEGKAITVRVVIRSDNNGRLYYDHSIKEPELVSAITNAGVTQVSNGSINSEKWIVNLFIKNQ